MDEYFSHDFIFIHNQITTEAHTRLKCMNSFIHTRRKIAQYANLPTLRICNTFQLVDKPFSWYKEWKPNDFSVSIIDGNYVIHSIFGCFLSRSTSSYSREKKLLQWWYRNPNNVDEKMPKNMTIKPLFQQKKKKWRNLLKLFWLLGSRNSNKFNCQA